MLSCSLAESRVTEDEYGNNYYWNEGTLMEITYLKSAARLLNRDWANRRGLDLSRELLWVSVGLKGSRATSHQSWKFEKNSVVQPIADESCLNLAKWQNIFWPSTLTASSSAAHCLTETHSASLERSRPYLLTKSLSQSLAALLGCFIFVQNTLISIGLIYIGCHIHLS